MQYTPQQEAAITIREPRVCVDAGAGSGKTRVLIDRIVHLLAEGGAGLDEIAAITFTEKAAAEMKDRLRAAFRANAPRDNPEAMNRWRELERRVENARIATIHAFCATLLRENALWLGIDPDFAVLAEAETVLLRRAETRRTLHALFERRDPDALALATELGVKGLENLLITLIAQRALLERAKDGLGAGDPDALAARWRELVAAEHVRLIEGLRHSRKLAALLRTLRSFDNRCTNPEDARELKRQTMLAGIGRIIEGAPVAEIQKIIADILAKPGRASRKNWEDDEELFKAITDAQKKVTDFFKAIENPPETPPGMEEAAARLTCGLVSLHARCAAAFQKAKAEANSMDFDDLIAEARRALRENETLRQRAARDIRFLLIDEFQDTDSGQLEIARLLAGNDAGPELFIVGDAKQSIYRFRGAEVEVFGNERARASIALVLDKNFRSLPDVLEFVNHFFKESGMLSAVEDYQPMQAHRNPRHEARVEFLFPPAPPEKLDAEGQRRAEADLIARRILELRKAPAMVEAGDGVFRPAQFGDIALLFRAKSNVAIYEEALRARGIPYTLSAGAGFYRRQEILDILNLLKTVLDPWDETALLGFLRSPIAGLSDASLLLLTRRKRLVPAFVGGETLDDADEAGRLDAARALIDTLRAEATQPVPAFLRRLLEITGYEAVLLSQHHGVQKTSNVRKLIDLAADFSRRRPPTLAAFLRYLDEVRGEAVRESEADLQPEGANAVTLLTIHKSKGLEFPIVLIPDMGQGRQAKNADPFLFHRELGLVLKVAGPDGQPATPALGVAIKARIAEEEEAEDARLLYVALTRARDHLICSSGPEPSAKSWFDALNGIYNCIGLPDGKVIQGDSWAITVRREAEAGETVPESGAAGEAPGYDALLARAEPLQGVPAVRRTLSISALLDHLAHGLDAEEERGQEERAPRNESAAARAMARGTLVHRMFELWDFASGALPPIGEIVADAALGVAGAAKYTEALTAIARRFQQSALGQRFAKEPRILREAPFALCVGDIVINGTIDALLGDGTIIDYKTGAVTEARNARYEWQLLLYAAAVRELRGKMPQRGILCYVDADEVHEVLFTEDQIAAALRHAREAAEALLG